MLCKMEYQCAHAAEFEASPVARPGALDARLAACCHAALATVQCLVAHVLYSFMTHFVVLHALAFNSAATPVSFISTTSAASMLRLPPGALHLFKARA